MGFAELFIDPVILAKINRDTPRQLLSTITAIYYLFVGALANFLSGKVADLSAIPSQKTMGYEHLFSDIAWVGGAATLILIVLVLFARKLSRASTGTDSALFGR